MATFCKRVTEKPVANQILVNVSLQPKEQIVFLLPTPKINFSLKDLFKIYCFATYF